MTDRDSGQAQGRARPFDVEEVEARAARLGITRERVLEEYARIAFAKITDIVEWDEKLVLKPSCDLSDDQVAAIAEIVCSASDKKPYRIKMHDKKPVLDAIARHLGMFPKKPAQNEDEHDDDGEDARELLARKLARIIAGSRDRQSSGEHVGRGDPAASAPLGVVGA